MSQQQACSRSQTKWQLAKPSVMTTNQGFVMNNRCQNLPPEQSYDRGAPIRMEGVRRGTVDWWGPKGHHQPGARTAGPPFSFTTCESGLPLPVNVVIDLTK